MYLHHKNKVVKKEDLERLQTLKQELEEVLNTFKGELFLPCSIFTSQLSGLETIVKYLKEQKNLSLTAIANLLDRSPKTIWQTYTQSKKKYSSFFKEQPTPYHIPISLFKQRHLAVLEHLVFYLKEEYGLSFSQIATILHRDQRTIWTVYHRATKKNVKK